MHFEPNGTYHVYNRSNELLFKTQDNYLYFIEKIKILIKPYADILAWCLMPNHFHIMLVANAEGCKNIGEEHRGNTQQLSKMFGLVLSSYTQGFNKQNKRRGSLFVHSTKAKCLNELTGDSDYGIVCFNYIHKNPIEAGLCSQLSEWDYRSYNDYAGLRNGTLVNKQLASEMLPINLAYFEQQSLAALSNLDVEEIY